jgi:UDP-N-acetylmuramoyl-L-alanyl-D-glutamate--2,6-diaminopimelate ligase
VTPEGRFPVTSPLIGTYNVSNILAAVGVAFSQGIQPAAIQAGVAAVRSLRGRMDPIDAGQDFGALVDFAHTPNALQRALETARELTTGQVIVVFGCAGLRDREKRPWMGELAGRLADRIVITAEDPRTESLDAIMAQIARGCQRVRRREGEGFWRIGDRAEAIRFAVSLARPGDVVIVCGKGHEQSMCFGTTEYPWSDHAVLRAALENRLVG